MPSVRDILPAGLVKAISNYRWSKTASRPLGSWAAAARSAVGYDSDQLSEFRVARWKSNRRPADLSIFRARPAFDLMLAQPLGGHIVEFGGATGETGEAVLQLRKDLKYTVVENPSLVRRMADISDVKFAPTIPAAFDLFLRAVRLGLSKIPWSSLSRLLPGRAAQ